MPPIRSKQPRKMVSIGPTSVTNCDAQIRLTSIQRLARSPVNELMNKLYRQKRPLPEAAVRVWQSEQIVLGIASGQIGGN